MMMLMVNMITIVMMLQVKNFPRSLVIISRRSSCTFLSKGKNACYLYLEPGRRYVGRWILWNDFNDRILHGVSLDEGYVKVHFVVAVLSEANTQLPRPRDEANIVGHCQKPKTRKRIRKRVRMLWPKKRLRIKKKRKQLSLSLLCPLCN